MFVWQAHQGRIRSLAFSPDGQLLATATGTGRLISLWNPLTGERVRKLSPKCSDRATNAVAFAPATPLFAAGLHRSVRVWNTQSWEEVDVLTAAELWAGSYFELVFGPGTTPSLAAADSRKVRVWEELGREAPPPHHPSTVFNVENTPGLDFSPSGEMLGVNVLARAELVSARTGAQLQALEHSHSQHHGPIKFSPDGRRVAVGYRNFVSIYPVEPDSGEIVTCAGHKKAVWSAGWAVNGQSLYTASADGTARQWNPTTGEEMRTFEWGIGAILSTAFSPDGLLGAAASKDGKVVVWDLDT